MNRYFQIILLILVFIPIRVYSQYQLVKAFPDLPRFSLPAEFVHADDGTNRLFVVQQRGLIYTFDNNPLANSRKVFLDLRNLVSQGGSDFGLLGLAFHPNFENNRKLYVYYTIDSVGSQSGKWCRLSAFTADSLNPDTVYQATQDILITFSKQPTTQHNGGRLAFGPDGYLYFSVGDGGGPGDPLNNGQSRTSWLGKIHRINVDTMTGGRRYGIPPGNPYANDPVFKKELYAYGFRNVWKFSFDLPTNRLWAADVGNTAREEIDIIQNGKNYGWNKMEGFICYPENNCDTTGRNFTRPVVDFIRDSAVSIIGGYVYRGTQLPELYGKYLFADWYYGRIWALDYQGPGQVTYNRLLDSNMYLSSFGVDQNNEVYLLQHSYADSTSIYKIVNNGKITVNVKLIQEGQYNIPVNTLNKNDTVMIKLYSYPGLIQIDSALSIIDSLTFTGLFEFPTAQSGIYFISVKTKNGVETWSKPGGEFMSRGYLYNYDFTTGLSQAFGNNLKQIGSVYCMISGDCNQDGIINALDRAELVEQTGMSGTLSGDLDGNGIVNEADKLILISNLGKSKITP
ncbi:MAG: hypothetical protein HGGPFJEG_02114 [Ignavibacteria bacterium]|nr:hypothetical protein [Ignavibacteria bacterium]